MDLIAGCYRAELHRGQPERGYGYFDSRTGVLRYYSDGGSYYYELGTGKAVFYVAGDSIHYLGAESG